MIALASSLAFHPELSPDYLFRTAPHSDDPELEQELREFAADWATIRNLPETPRTIRAVV